MFTIPNKDQAGITANPQAIWMEADITALVSGLKSDGLKYGCAVTAQASPNMTVAVAKGTTKVSGVVLTVTAGNCTIAAANATNSRVDLISVNSSGTKVVTQGTASATPKAPAIPASSVLLAMVHVPANASSIITAYITDKRVFSSTKGLPEGWFDIEDFGAVPDNATDCSDAFDAAIAAAKLHGYAGTIFIPDGDFVITRTITLGDALAPSATTFLNIVGTSPDSVIAWTGSTSGVAINLVRNKYFQLANFTLSSAVAVGSSIGIQLSGYGGVGTETLSGNLERVYTYGFHIGLRVGTTTVAASEISCYKCGFNYADIGIYTGEDLNTLNINFYDCDVTFCNTKGMHITEGNVGWVGGSSTHNPIDFFTDGTAPINISNARFEVAGVGIKGKGDVNVNSCIFTNGGGTYAIYKYSGNLVVRNSIVATGLTITVADQINSVTITDTRVPTGTTYPCTFVYDGILDGQMRCPAIFQNNGIYNSSDKFSDIYGTAKSAYHETPVFFPIATTIKIQQNPDTGYPGYTQFNRLRMISQGTYVDGKNIRGQDKFATAGTVTVDFNKTKTVTPVTATTATFAAGDLNIADVGKRITIASISYSGEITGIAGTTVTTRSNNNTTLTGGAASAVIGEDEPDSLYFITLGGNANESFYTANKATTGFDIKSSNASSTATVDWMLMR